MSNAPLRQCPTCLRPADGVEFGLRDYRWVNDALPGRVGPMDLDFLLERHGKVLAIEFKPTDMMPGMGAAITLRTLRKLGAEVWLVHGDGPYVQVKRMSDAGVWEDQGTWTLEGLALAVREWFDAA